MNLMQGGGGRCDVASHPGGSRSTSSHLMLLTVEISLGLMGHLAHMETLLVILLLGMVEIKLSYPEPGVSLNVGYLAN